MDSVLGLRADTDPLLLSCFHWGVLIQHQKRKQTQVDTGQLLCPTSGSPRISDSLNYLWFGVVLVFFPLAVTNTMTQNNSGKETWLTGLQPIIRRRKGRSLKQKLERDIAYWLVPFSCSPPSSDGNAHSGHSYQLTIRKMLPQTCPQASLKETILLLNHFLPRCILCMSTWK